MARVEERQIVRDGWRWTTTAHGLVRLGLGLACAELARRRRYLCRLGLAWPESVTEPDAQIVGRCPGRGRTRDRLSLLLLLVLVMLWSLLWASRVWRSIEAIVVTARVAVVPRCRRTHMLLRVLEVPSGHRSAHTTQPERKKKVEQKSL